jgi:membrane dipeptidase
MQAWPDADFANAHRHGANALAVTAWRPHDDVVNALEGVMFWHLIERKYPNVVIAWSADDVRAAKINGQIALIISAQGGDFIANKIHRVEAFHRLGLRMMLFAYNASNAICDGALDRTTSGLTRFGRMVVAECNRLGVLIDCTHVGEQASLQIIDESAEPVIFSHSNANTISPSLRNISDEQILACVPRGGVIGLAPFGPLVIILITWCSSPVPPIP